MEKLKLKRRQLTINEKLKIIDAAKSNIGSSELSKEFKVARTTIIGILKGKELIKNAVDDGIGLKYRKIRSSGFVNLEKALLIWFKQVRSQNIPVSGQIVQQKAKEIAIELRLDNFTASYGWLRNFLKRHSIVFKSIQGEAAEIDMTELESWQQQILQENIKDYSPHDVFNADESALFWRLLPNKTFTFKDERCSNGKKSKDRITVLIGANMTGSEKLPLLVIGKYSNPRCFKNKVLPVKYFANNRAWMTACIFENWLKEWNRNLVRAGRKILLYIDNCSAHPPTMQFSNINLKFFLPNTTAVSQPMDQGIIQNIKMFYKRSLLRRQIDSIDASTPFIFNLLDALHILQHSWNTVKSETIRKCFGKAKFFIIEESPDDKAKTSNDEEIIMLWETLQANEILENKVSLNDYIMMDQEVVTDGIMTIKDIISSVAGQESENREECVELEEIKLPTISNKVARKYWNDLRRYLENDENNDPSFMNLCYKIEDLIAKRRLKDLRQQSLFDHQQKN